MAHILIVDDSISVRKALEITFKRHALSSVSAVSGEEALETLQGQPAAAFDLLMVDVIMPGMSGLELCASLRQQPRFEHLPVILMSGNIDDDIRQQARDAGATTVLRKPFSPEELIPLVESLLPLRGAGSAETAPSTGSEVESALSNIAALLAAPVAPGPAPAAPATLGTSVSDALAGLPAPNTGSGAVTAFPGLGAPDAGTPATRVPVASFSAEPAVAAPPEVQTPPAPALPAGPALSAPQTPQAEPAASHRRAPDAAERLINQYQNGGQAEALALLDARHQLLGHVGQPLDPRLLTFAAYFVNTARVIGQQFIGEGLQTVTLRYLSRDLILHVQADFTLVVLTRLGPDAGKVLN